MINIKKTAERIGIKECALRKMARTGKIPHVIIAGRYMFDVELLEDVFKKEMLNNIESEDKADD